MELFLSIMYKALYFVFRLIKLLLSTEPEFDCIIQIKFLKTQMQAVICFIFNKLYCSSKPVG